MNNEYEDLYDEALARQIEEQEATGPAEADAEDAGASANDALMADLSEASLNRADEDADTLVGARIGNLSVLSREKPGKRPFYVCRERRSGQEIRLRGYQLVRAARRAVNDGLPVYGLREPWRNETPETPA